MNVTRAEEILSSKDVIGVKYRNNYVWIESVDKGKNTAYVTYLEERNTVHVDVGQLEETGPVIQ